ncbi:MAG: hypothetical protein ACOYN4_08745, partial [Bacteroidales bacterium]
GLLYGQYYNLGQDPASIKWRQVKMQHFHIIYPESFEPKMQKLGPTFDFAYKNIPTTLAYQPKPIPFIVHNYNTDANAITVWAPKRVELFTCPPQDSYAQDWLDQLILHEYRHVAQIDRTNQGFTKVLSWFAGEQAAAMINGLFVPPWFMEGDAVCAETALSNVGRGRIPTFEMLLRAQVLQKGAFSYDKAALGSYKTFVPNRYVLGYSLVANVRKKYGYQTWITALDEVARKPFLITPFNHGLKKATGYGKVDLYKATLKDMDSLWGFQDENTQKTAYRQISITHKRKYENYIFPYYLNDYLIVAEFSGMDEIAKFVVINPDGSHKTITTPGFLSSEVYSVVNKSDTTGKDESLANANPTDHVMLAWTESINDPRWQERNYSEIRIYDSYSGKVKKLTKKSRYFSPCFSPDGKFIAAVKMDVTNRCSIVLLNPESGREINVLLASDSDFYMTPSWSNDGQKIVFTKLDEKGKGFFIIDLPENEISEVLEPTFTEISNPVFAGGFVLFNGAYSGIQNIYAINLIDKKVFQVTSAEFGAANARLSPDRKKIVYSNYTSTGYGLVEMEFEPKSFKSLSDIHDYSASLYKHLVAEENINIDSNLSKSSQIQSEPYKKAAHILNFHSWAPAYINYSSAEYGTGISFMSQNDLSTATTMLGYSYDMAEKTGKFTADFSWMAWYPILDFKASYGKRAAYTSDDTAVHYNYNETILGGGLTLPLVFTGGKYYKGLQLKLHSSWHNITNNTSPEDTKLAGTINSVDYGVYLYRYIKQSGKDIYPRWGQVLNLGFRNTPFGDNNYGSIASISTRFYFPGLLQHHGLRLDLNWQERRPGSYYYPNQINLPRGYYMFTVNSLKIFALSYKFPLLYPDFSLGPLAYFKRIKATLFYDGGTGVTKGDSWKLQSTGVELTLDLHVLRFVFPMDLGFRFGYRPVEKSYFVDFLFSVNLSN